MIHDRIDYIKKLTKDYELTPVRHWSVSHLAIETNNKLEYDAFFKLHSKYVHPSAWIMNSHDYEYDNPVFRSIFLSQGQIYANRIVKSIKKISKQVIHHLTTAIVHCSSWLSRKKNLTFSKF